MDAVLDVYDDGGALLRRRTIDQELPDWIKEASYPADVPDDLFAVVVDGPKPLRKFACDTAANTVLSMLYFRDVSPRLGPELEKVAARRLMLACGWYGLNPPDDLIKKADVSGTSLAPYTPKSKAEVQQGLDQAAGLRAVKTTGSSPKTAARYADPLRKQYPLDAFDDIVAANRYFDKYASEFPPSTRLMMAVNIYKRSCEIGIPAGRRVRDEAMRKVASVDTVQDHLRARAAFYGTHTEAGRMFQGLAAKTAALHPRVMMETVAQLDTRYGGDVCWDRQLPTPWDVVLEKTAGDEKGPEDYSYDFGTWKVSGTDLVRLAKKSGQVDERFGRDFAEGFRADPIPFFEHLPRPEKEVLARMAHDLDSPGSDG